MHVRHHQPEPEIQGKIERMPKKPLTVNGRDFASQGEATVYYRNMLNRYAPGQRVSEPEAVDLAELLTRHPEAAEKIGAGIDHFEVRMAPQFSTQCFWVVRTDGTATDFSMGSCITGRAKSVSQEFREACRMAVQNDISAAKRTYFNERQDASGRVPCEITGRPLTMDEAHADHREPMRFEVIVAGFLASKSRDEPDPAWLTVSRDAQAVTTFVDRAIHEEFRDYHRRLARLRWIDDRVNLSLGGKGQLRHSKGSIKLK
jgi:hypothetical protein